MSLMLLDYRDLPHEKARTVARVIHDWDPQLELKRLPNTHPFWTPEKPYAVLHRPGTDFEYVVGEAVPESMLDERLIAIVIESDTRRFDRKLDKFDALTHAHHVLVERQRADRHAEKYDKMQYKLKKRRWE